MTSPITSILAATDFSLPAAAAVGYAHALAKEVGASLRVIHVCEDPTTAAGWIDDSAPMMPEWREQLDQQAQGRLLSLTASLHGVPIATEVVLNRSPARGIVERAIAGGHDLIVIGTHGSRGLAHVVLGSVAERVVRSADCPVLTIRQSKPVAASEDVAARSDIGRPWLASLAP